MRGSHATICLVFTAYALGGCVTRNNNPLTLLHGGTHIESSMLQASGVEATQRTPECYLDVVLDRSPERPYVILGRATALRTEVGRAALTTTGADVLPHLRQEACRAGGHVLFQVRSHYQDQWISGVNTRQRRPFVRTVRMTGLVGVYVRRDGNAVAAPTSPRRVIRVPTQVDRTTTIEPEDDGLTWDQGIADPWAVPAP